MNAIKTWAKETAGFFAIAGELLAWGLAYPWMTSAARKRWAKALIHRMEAWG